MRRLTLLLALLVAFVVAACDGIGQPEGGTITVSLAQAGGVPSNTTVAVQVITTDGYRYMTLTAASPTGQVISILTGPYTVSVAPPDTGAAIETQMGDLRELVHANFPSQLTNDQLASTMNNLSLTFLSLRDHGSAGCAGTLADGGTSTVTVTVTDNLVGATCS